VPVQKKPVNPFQLSCRVHKVRLDEIHDELRDIVGIARQADGLRSQTGRRDLGTDRPATGPTAREKLSSQQMQSADCTQRKLGNLS